MDPVKEPVNVEDRHPSVRHFAPLFRTDHLPPDLAKVSQPFADLAEHVASGPQNAETSAALRKLLEAKDCAVRAHRV